MGLGYVLFYEIVFFVMFDAYSLEFQWGALFQKLEEPSELSCVQKWSKNDPKMRQHPSKNAPQKHIKK